MTLGIVPLIWLITIGYAVLYSGEQLLHHCKLSTYAALTGAIPLCGSGAGASSAGKIDPTDAGFTARELDYARAQIGKPYQWGGPTNGSLNDPNNFDCSGLTRNACLFASGGRLNLPHNAALQMMALSRAKVPTNDRSAWAPGDLIFYFVATDTQTPGHVAIYVGDGQVIEAPHTGANVETAPVAMGPGTRIVGVRRPAAMPAGGGRRAHLSVAPSSSSTSSSTSDGVFSSGIAA